jgi:DNA-binding FadR family transcriptional regulator
VTSDFSAGGFRRSRTGAADQMLDDLRSRILSGELARGARLPSEKELAAHYDVSGPTVREAIRALSATSLVEARHGSGTYVVAKSAALMRSAMAAVAQLEGVDLIDILDMSEMFYRQAVILAVERATDDEIAELRTALADIDRGADGPALPDALRGFLLTLVALSHNGLLVAMASYLIETQTTVVRATTDRDPKLAKRVARPLAAHRKAVVDALEARDADAAATAVAAYTARGKELVRQNHLVRDALART